MKSILASLAVASVLAMGSANAVTVTLSIFANTSVGFVTNGASSTLVSGTMYFYTSAVNLAPADLNGLLAASDRRSFFEGKLVVPASDPVNSGLLVRTVAFTNGAFSSTGSNTEVGAIGRSTYVYIESGSLLGIYQTPSVPGTGPITGTPATVLEDLIGGSQLQNISGVNSGWQLVPEPSVALLGALGLFGLMRRRR